MAPTRLESNFPTGASGFVQSGTRATIPGVRSRAKAKPRVARPGIAAYFDVSLPKNAMLKYIVILFLISFRGILPAQDETIVLSPVVVSSDKASTKPPVVLKRRADFLLLQITVSNDTREDEKRRDEVYATLKGMVASIPKASKIELFTEEFTLTPTHFQIPLVAVADKRDASNVTFYAKVPLSESDDAGVLAEALRSFVRSVKIQGRTEIFSGDIGLSIRNPEKYRYEVVQAIAADVKKLREAFADSFESTVKGLDARLQWQRSSVSEVELFLPFKYELFPLKMPKMEAIEK